MKMPLLVCAATSFALSVRPSRTAEATTSFSTNAGSCIPGDPAINNGLYSVVFGRVTHKSTNTGLITVYCPILSDITAPSHIALTYSSTINDGSTFVDAGYIKMSKSSGSVTTIATARSQDGLNNGLVQVRIQPFTDSYSVSNYVYYVRVDMQRSSSAQRVYFYNVSVY